MSAPEPPGRFRSDLEGVTIVSPVHVPVWAIGLFGFLVTVGPIPTLMLFDVIGWLAAVIAAILAVALLALIWLLARARKTVLRISATHAVVQHGRRITRIPLHAIERVEATGGPDGSPALAVRWNDDGGDRRDVIAWRLEPEQRDWLQQALDDRAQGASRDREGERALDALRRGIEVQ